MITNLALSLVVIVTALTLLNNLDAHGPTAWLNNIGLTAILLITVVTMVLGM